MSGELVGSAGILGLQAGGGCQRSSRPVQAEICFARSSEMSDGRVTVDGALSLLARAEARASRRRSVLLGGPFQPWPEREEIEFGIAMGSCRAIFEGVMLTAWGEGVVGRDESSEAARTGARREVRQRAIRLLLNQRVMGL